jgi:hypothetical protein
MLSAFDIKVNETIGNIEGLNLKPIQCELNTVKRILLLRKDNIIKLLDTLSKLGI